MPRRTVHKIEPRRAVTFDQQFWPVLIAVCVLTAIAFGAALTLLSGPWMWLSLLLLPAAAATAVLFLSRLDDSLLRRSLQLAILVSLAAHLLILILASATSVFDNRYQPPTRQVAQRQLRVITIQNRQLTPFAWQQPVSQPTPDPQVVPQREQPTAVMEPRQLPVPQKQNVPDPQLTKREAPSRSVPRLDRQLSQLRRQTRNVSPKSALKSNSSSVIKSARPQTNPPAASPDQVASKTQKQPSPSPAENATANPLTVAPTRRAAASPRATRTTQVARPESPNSAGPPASSSSARIRRSAPRMPSPRTLPSPAESVATAVSPSGELKPAAAASRLNRQTTQSTSRRDSPQTQLSPQTQQPRVTARRARQPNPAISSQQSAVNTPRRSTTLATVAQSTSPLEAPSRNPKSSSPSRELNPRTLGVTRGQTGIAGSGAAQNLDRQQGGVASPASRASDSVARRRSQSQPTTTPLLVATQESVSRRSVAGDLSPQSAFKANTTAAARITGSLTPTDRSLEASAATIDSRTNSQTGAVNAERGESNIDIGPTKIVQERSAERRSAGGQPDVGNVTPDPTRRSNANTSERVATLLADAGAESVAPRNPTSAPSSAENLQPQPTAIAEARAGGQQPTAFERSADSESSSSTTGGASTDADTGMENRLARQLAESRDRAVKNQPAAPSEDEDQEQTLAGNSPGRLAQAPIVSNQPAAGFQSNAAGSTPRPNAIDSDSQSLNSQVVSRSAGSNVGSLARDVVGREAQPALTPILDRSSRSTQRPRRANGSGSSSSDSAVSESAARQKTRTVPQVNLQGENSTLSGMTVSDSTNSAGSADEPNAAEVAAQRSDAVDGAMLEIDAPTGPAGLAEQRSTALGVRSRPASRDSTQIEPNLENRFRNDRFGGTPAINPDAILAREAFRSRNPSGMVRSAPSTEESIRLGLEFLARYQNSDGSWSLNVFDRQHPSSENLLNSDTAATGLALLAFQGAGYNHREFKYAAQMKRALDWLIENQDDDGGLYVSSDRKSDSSCRMYSHAIAALALTEAYGMTQDRELVEPAQRAIDYISATQDPVRGGWRYFATRELRSTDTSVTAWMMMALQSARLSDLEVADSTLSGITRWLDTAADPNDDSQFRYNPYAVDTVGISRQQGRDPSPTMTAVGLLMRIYTGWDKSDPRLQRGARTLLDKRLPGDTSVLQRDTYYWYYATQVLKHMDGELWERWHQQLHPLLIRSQVKTGDLAGSWHPFEPVPDRWGIHGGRLYVTTMNLLSLEVRYRLLPLYEKTVDGFDK